MHKDTKLALILLVPATILVGYLPFKAYNTAIEMGYTNGYSTFSTSGTITPLVLFASIIIGSVLLIKLAKFTSRFIQA
jgi:hypothetical protein